MKRKVLVGIAFVYLTVAIFSVAPSVSADDQINFGQIVSGSIDNPLQVKIYSFSATANDQFLVRVSRTEGEFDPQFKLYSPNGKKIAEDYSVVSLVEGSGTLPDSGTYQILICDKGGNDIGKFSLLIVRMNSHTSVTIPTPTSQTVSSIPTPKPTSAIPTSVTTTPIIPTSMPASSPDETLPSCEKGYKDCYPPWGDCETNIYEDNDNCGDCGNQCPEGYFCLLGSCVEDTTANKEKLAAYYMEQYQRYEEEKRYEDAKNYLLKAKDVYIDINRPGQVLEIDGLIEEIEEKIFERDIFELVFEIAIAVILAVFFGFIFARKTKKVSLWIVVTSSAMVFFIVFLVLRLWILPIFY